jgi:hypothetical protein
MNALKMAWEEFIGLFIDDGSLAVAIVVWVALVGFLFPHLPRSSQWGASLLFVGLAAILVENILRRARKS